MRSPDYCAMPLIKNPFKSKGPTHATNIHSSGADDPLTPPPTVRDTGASPRPSVTILRRSEPDYKLSSVSPEGTFMPPSPPERASFMSRIKNSTVSSSSRQATPKKDDDSGFLIPRESFDTYRRSFDIRPSMDGTGQLNDGRPSRASLDLLSAAGGPSPRRPSQPSIQPTKKTPVGTTLAERTDNTLAPPLQKQPTGASIENEFEDVRLDEESGTVKKKHFWQRGAGATNGNRKGRDDENELGSIQAAGKRSSETGSSSAAQTISG